MFHHWDYEDDWNGQDLRILCQRGQSPQELQAHSVSRGISGDDRGQNWTDSAVGESKCWRN